MSDRIKLTTEDIEKAQRQAEANPIMPEAVTIGPADLPPEAPMTQHTAPLIKITKADLVTASPHSIRDTDIEELEKQMVVLINQARCRHLPRWIGTMNLRWHPQLAAVARQHSHDMRQRHYVQHVTPEGITAAQRITQAGIHYLACGENIGIVYGPTRHGRQGVRDIHHTFMNQPRRPTNHRGNLLNPIWTHVGVGIAYTVSGTLVATQNFISAPGRH